MPMESRTPSASTPCSDHSDANEDPMQMQNNLSFDPQSPTSQRSFTLPTDGERISEMGSILGELIEDRKVQTAQLADLRFEFMKSNLMVQELTEWQTEAALQINSLMQGRVESATKIQSLTLEIKALKAQIMKLQTAGDEKLARELQDKFTAEQKQAPRGEAPPGAWCPREPSGAPHQTQHRPSPPQQLPPPPQHLPPPSQQPPPGWRGEAMGALPYADFPPLPRQATGQYPPRTEHRVQQTSIPLTHNPYELLAEAEQNPRTLPVQVVQRQHQLNPAAPCFHTPYLGPQHQTWRAPPPPTPHQEEARKQAELDLKLRLTNSKLTATADSDLRSQVVSFLSENLKVPSTDLKIDVDTSTPHHSSSPIITITCQDIDTKKMILRNKRNMKGNVSTWIEPCLTQWQMAERRKKEPWKYFLREQGTKTFFHSHRLMCISEGGITEVTTAPH